MVKVNGELHGKRHDERHDDEAAPAPGRLIREAGRIGMLIAGEASRWDQAGQPNPGAFDAIRASRIGAIRVPVALGGAGGGIADVVAVTVALAKGDSSVAQAMLPHFVFVERTLLMASDMQITHWLTQVAGGALVGGASAEGGGTFRGEVRTSLTADGDGYRLNGVKRYSTGALMGDLLKVAAVDDTGQAVLAVLPVNREGIVRHDDWDGMGQRGTMSGTTELINVRVERADVQYVGRWKKERHHTGSASQIIHCAIEVGIALAALDDAAAWVSQGVRPVKESGVDSAGEDPYILHTLGRVSAHVRAAEAMVKRAAQRIDVAAAERIAAGGETTEQVAQRAIDAAIATAHAKAVSTDAALLAGQALFDVGGASTTLRKHNFDRHWRNARTHTVHDPLAYKYRAIGDYTLNGRPPPIDYGY